MKNIVSAIALLFLVQTGFTQQRGPQGTPDEQATKRVEQLDKILTLKKIQKDSIYQVLLTEAKTREATFKDRSSERPDREAMRTAMEKTNTKIKSFLTAEQVKKFDENQQQMMQKRESKESN